MSARELSNDECDAIRRTAWEWHAEWAFQYAERDMIRAAYTAGRAAVEAELDAMTKERDEAEEVVQQLTEGKPFVSVVAARVYGSVLAAMTKERNAALARGKAAEKDAARWKWIEMEAGRAGVDMDNARSEIDDAIAKESAI